MSNTKKTLLDVTTPASKFVLKQTAITVAEHIAALLLLVAFGFIVLGVQNLKKRFKR